MIQVFRKNWFVNTLLLLPYALLTRIWAFFDMPAWPYDTEKLSPAYRYLEQFFPENYTLNVLVATVLVFIAAAQINNIVIKNRIARDINLYPGMAFIFLSALHKDMFWLSPQLISIIFILVAIANVFRIYQKPNAGIYLFNSGFFMGLSSVFFFPYSILIIFCFIAVMILRKFELRDFIQMITGFLLVYFFVLFVHFWNDVPVDFYELYIKQFSWALGFKSFALNEWIIFGINAFLIIVSITNYRKFTIKKSIQSQKKVNLIYWFMIIAIISLVFIPTIFIFSGFMVIYISFAVYLGMLMTRFKNEAAMELLHLFLLFFIVFSHFWF